MGPTHIEVKGDWVMEISVAVSRPVFCTRCATVHLAYMTMFMALRYIFDENSSCGPVYYHNYCEFLSGNSVYVKQKNSRKE